MGSAKFFFSYLIYGISLLGFDWYSVLFFFKFLLVASISPVLFLTIFSIYLKWRPKDYSKNFELFIKFFLFFGSLGFFAFLQGRSTAFAPFGWGAIQYYYFLSPMTLSFFMGLIHNLFFFNNNKFFFLSSLFLFFSTLLHPIIGICHFVITVIFVFPLETRRKLFFKLCQSLVFLIIPLAIYFIFFQNSDPYFDTSGYIDFYIKVRTPHHYMMSEVIGIHSIKWIILFLIPLYFSFKLNEKKFKYLSILIFSSIIFAPSLQFIGTELFEMEIIADIGPSRFTAYTSILWGLNIIIIGTCYYNEKIKIKKNLISKYLNSFAIFFNNSFLILNKFFIRKSFIAFSYSFILICAFFVSNKHPLDFHYNGNAKQLIHWIKNNTQLESTFFVKNIDNFIIRVYGERPVFADAAYTFNKSTLNEFIIRFEILSRSKNFKVLDFMCLNKIYDIDYYLTTKSNKFLNVKTTYSDDNWVVYDLNEMNTEYKCDK